MSEEQQPLGRFSVLIVVTLGAFLTQIMISALNVALPAIQAEFHMKAAPLAWLQTSFLLSTAVFMVPAGRLADLIGRKKTYMLGLLIYTLASAACALAFSGPALIALRIPQGVGGAMIFATGMALLTSAFPPGERGRAIGLAVAGAYIGLCVGPVVGGFVTHYFGWRLVFWSNVALGLLAVILCATNIKGEWAEARGESFDIPGSLIYGATLVLLMLGLTRLPHPGGVGLFLAGLAALIGFYYCEKNRSYPVLDISLFVRNRVFAFSSVAALINYAATFAIVFLLSLYLQYIKAMTPQKAGWILVVQPAVMAVFSPLIGRFSDRANPRVLAAAGMTVTGLALCALAFLNQASSLWLLIVNLAVLGLGFSLFLTPNTSILMSSVEKRHMGLASGAVSTMRTIGQMLSMGIAALIFSLIMGEAKITPDLYPRFLVAVRICFLVFGLMCLLGVYPSMVRGRPR